MTSSERLELDQAREDNAGGSLDCTPGGWNDLIGIVGMFVVLYLAWIIGG
jgi:hypothetical protein